MDINIIVSIGVFLAIGAYHILSDYFQKKKAINIKEDIFTLEDRLKAANKLALETIQYEEIIQDKISKTIEAAVLKCTLTSEEKHQVLESINNFQKGNITAEEIYNNLERDTEEPIYDMFSLHRKLRK